MQLNHQNVTHRHQEILCDREAALAQSLGPKACLRKHLFVRFSLLDAWAALSIQIEQGLLISDKME